MHHKDQLKLRLRFLRHENIVVVVQQKQKPFLILHIIANKKLLSQALQTKRSATKKMICLLQQNKILL